jgi:membrane-associated protein
MPYKEFLRFNIIGGIVWTAGITLAGYYLGKLIPNAEHYLYPMVIVVIGLSFLPVIHEWRRSRK